MPVDVASYLSQFAETNDFAVIAELDRVPPDQFDNPWISQQYYMHTRSRQSYGYTCFQHAMAYALDHFHPGIVSYVDSVYPVAHEDLAEEFTEILDGFLRAGYKQRIKYRDIVGPRVRIKTGEELIAAVESSLVRQGYLIAMHTVFHGELYTLENVDDQVYMKLAHRYHHDPIRLWKMGEIGLWLSEKPMNERSGLAEQVLLGDYLLLEDVGLSRLDTDFIGREEFESALSAPGVLEKIVHLPKKAERRSKVRE